MTDRNQNKTNNTQSEPGRHGSRKLTVLIIVLSVALAAAIGFRLYLFVKDYIEYRKGVEVYSGFKTPDDADFPEFDPSETEAETDIAAETDSDTASNPAETTAAEITAPAETAVQTEAATATPATTASAAAAPTAATQAAATQAVYTFADFVSQLKWLDSKYGNFYCWIRIRNTVINYPVVQGDDNEYYLTHDIYGNKLSLGAIFADYRCADIDNARNLVIYGHRAGYDIMFNSLADYFDSNFFNNNPYIYIYTPANTYVYEVYAAYTASMYSNFNRVVFNTDKEFLDHMNSFLNGATLKRNVKLEASDKILTLSTCTNYKQSERYVVSARLVSRTAN